MLRRRRRVTLRCDPRGPPPPRAGAPPRPAPAGAPPAGAPGRDALKPPPPGRDGAPVRGGPVLGRAPMGREPLEGPPRPTLGVGRRAPGGGGMGRPDALSGRPGGGGIGRPDALSGGRVAPVPSPAPPRWVGRIVVGPSGETVRVGTGFGGATLERTTFTSGTGASATGAGVGAAGAGVSSTGAEGGGDTSATRAGASATGAGAAGVVTLAALVALLAFSAFAGSAGTSRRSPSASARRRMRSACASSIDADGLEAPIPSFWASASNSLLVSPSSLESSCTRIFFGAKTFPYFAYPHIRRAQFPILSQLRPFLGREAANRREVCLPNGGP
jgi:hypothetical protein